MKEKGSTIYQLFLLLLSVYVLVALFLEEFVITGPEIRSVLQYMDISICCVFLLDFFVNLYQAERKLEYLKWGWIDLVSAIPVLDSLRWGRLSRVIRILRFLRTIKSIKVLFKRVQESKFETFTFVVILVTFMSYSVSAAMILEFERGTGSVINTAEDALWWSFLNILNAKIAITQTATTGGTVLTLFLNKIGLLLFATYYLFKGNLIPIDLPNWMLSYGGW